MPVRGEWGRKWENGGEWGVVGESGKRGEEWGRKGGGGTVFHTAVLYVAHLSSRDTRISDRSMWSIITLCAYNTKKSVKWNAHK